MYNIAYIVLHSDNILCRDRVQNQGGNHHSEWGNKIIWLSYLLHHYHYQQDPAIARSEKWKKYAFTFIREMKSEKFWLSLLLSRNEKWKENEWKWNFLRISEITRKMRILTTFLFSKNKNKPKIWYWLIVPCNHSQDLFKIIMINHLECWWSWSPWPPAPYCVDLLSTTLGIYSWAKGVSTLCTHTICLPLYPLWSIINLYCHHYHLLSLYCRTTMAEKLCHQWNDFKNNTMDALGRLREDKDFSDVTLACEDGQQMEAHKVILAVSSPFFQRFYHRQVI